jgi:hypothetical protein
MLETNNRCALGPAFQEKSFMAPERPYIVAIDFDGTIVKHHFPYIGEPVPGAFDWLHRFTREGARLILWTMRCCEGSAGDVLTPAIEFCRSRGIHFWGVNENPQQSESRWSTSGKVYAHSYIDDCAAGTPLINDPLTRHAPLPYVDWSLVGPLVFERIKLHKGFWDLDVSALNAGTDVWGVDVSPKTELPEPKMVEL